MNASRRFAECALLVACLASTPALACTIIGERLEDVRADEYVFYGEVKGYTSIHLADCKRGTPSAECGESWGLELAVLAPLQMPKPLQGRIDLFSFGLSDGLCASETVSESNVRQVPLGTRFKIAAKAITFPGSDRKKVALDGNDYSGAVVIPISPRAGLATIVGEKFDYTWSRVNSNEEARFEVRKDLLRLKKARSERNSRQILLRLAAYEGLTGTDERPDRQAASPFDRIVDAHIHEPKSLRAIQQRLLLLQQVYADDADAATEALLAIDHRPDFQVARAMQLNDHDVTRDGVLLLERTARSGYLPAMLHLARAAASLAEDAEYADPAAERAYRRKSIAAFRRTIRIARERSREDDAVAMLVLAAMYRKGEGGLPVDEEKADALQCLGFQYPPREPLELLGLDSQHENQWTCAEGSTGAPSFLYLTESMRRSEVTKAGLDQGR